MLQPELKTKASFIDMKQIETQVLSIAKRFEPEKIILFGSYATGNPTPDSDVDLLVIMNTGQSTWDAAVEISLMVKHAFPMDTIVRTPQQIVQRLNYGDFFIKDILENGNY